MYNDPESNIKIQEINYGDGLTIKEIQDQNQQDKNEQQGPLVPLTTSSQNHAPVLQNQQVESGSLGPSNPKADENVPLKTNHLKVKKQSTLERPQNLMPANNPGPPRSLPESMTILAFTKDISRSLFQ